jgi:trigger factor
MADIKTGVEDISSVSKRVRVEIPSEMVGEFFKKELEKCAKTAEIKGFRKGKAPLSIVEQHYMHDIVKGTVSNLIESTYLDALAKEGLAPISEPSIEPGTFDKDGPFSYSLTFEVYPSVEIKGYKELRLAQPEVVVTDDEVEKGLEELRERAAYLEPLPDGACADAGVVLTVDISGSLVDDISKRHDSKDVTIELGKGALLKQVEDGLKGAKVGEERTIRVDYPNDFHDKGLAGKTWIYKVKIKDMKKKVLPPLTDELAKELGDYKSLEELKTQVKDSIANAKNRVAMMRLADEALFKLIADNKFEVPPSMVMGELRRMYLELADRLSARGQKPEDVGITAEGFINENLGVAETRTRVIIILDAIARQENIEVLDGEVDARLEAIANEIKQPFDKVKKYYESHNFIDEVRARIRREKAIDLILKLATSSAT